MTRKLIKEYYELLKEAEKLLDQREIANGMTEIHKISVVWEDENYDLDVDLFEPGLIRETAIAAANVKLETIYYHLKQL